LLPYLLNRPRSLACFSEGIHSWQLERHNSCLSQAAKLSKSVKKRGRLNSNNIWDTVFSLLKMLCAGKFNFTGVGFKIFNFEIHRLVVPLLTLLII
jgi:hypothetical protein